jgi:hypothetical protein
MNAFPDPLSHLVQAPRTTALPWLRQPDESEEAWLTFLAWCFSTPQPILKSAEDSRLAAIHRWDQRAQLINARLRPTESPAQAVTAIAQDALVVLRHELAWRASQAVVNPGGASLGELVQLLKLCSDLGLSAQQAPSDTEAVDYSRLSEHELAVLAEASAILARAKSKAPHP